MKLVHAVLIAAIALTTACTHRATMSAPSGFGRVDGGYDFRAVSPQGLVVAARIKPNRPHADLGFWAAAVDLQLLRKGYARTASTEVKSTGGVPGVLMKYDTNSGDAYWIAVFARGGELLLAEATGWKADVDAAAPQLETSLLSARMN